MDCDEATPLQRLIDKDQIIDVVHRYSYCVDHGLYDEVADLFTEDCVVDYGPSWPSVRSRSSLRRILGEGGYEATSHHNANVLVTFEDFTHASVCTSVYAWHQQADGTTPRLWGYYHDSVVRLHQGWRIAERKLRALGTENWNVEMYSARDGEAR